MTTGIRWCQLDPASGRDRGVTQHGEAQRVEIEAQRLLLVTDRHADSGGTDVIITSSWRGTEITREPITIRSTTTTRAATHAEQLSWIVI